MSTNPYGVRAQWDSRQVATALAALAPRQWAFATAIALTRTAHHVKDAESAAMRTAFDRPTPFTLNSLYLQSATRDRQEARVWFKDFAPKGTAAGKYLMPQVHGGQRSDTRFERSLQRAGLLPKGKQLVPASGAPRDAFGNVQRGMYTRILSQLRASADPAQNTRRRRQTRRQRARGGTFFYGNPGGKAPGIWARFNFAFGNTVRPIFLETRKRPSYRARFAFFTIAERTAGTHIGSEFTKAAEHTLRTAR
jgi:hypothetical protein